MINAMDEIGDICKDSIEAKKIRNAVCKSGPIIWITYMKRINFMKKNYQFT